MKKITFLFLFTLISCFSFGQTLLIDFENQSFDPDTGEVSNDFSFGRVTTGNNRFNNPPYEANPSVDATNGSARVREVNVAVTNDGFGSYRIIFRNNFDLNAESFFSFLMRSDQNNTNINIQAANSDPNAEPFHGGDVTYTGNGDWQLVETTLTTSNGGSGVYPTLQFNPAEPTNGAYSFFIDDLTISSVTTLSSNEFNKTNASIYPNPARLAVNIRANITDKKAHIYNVSGKLLATKNITGDFNSVDVSRLSPGMYFLVLDSGSSFKFIKE
ncbi:T9SS type A sorting domain-containing protein [Hyunsoonleella sp. 2307UL5-6]|uniref:T9SS type A sorting domain-containing protein n=1 Tax=Hyunsoonleella sp. 2307UL5-6 TaxID=3384768 RepID=UPI0039BD5963